MSCQLSSLFESFKASYLTTCLCLMPVITYLTESMIAGQVTAGNYPDEWQLPGLRAYVSSITTNYSWMEWLGGGGGGWGLKSLLYLFSPSAVSLSAPFLLPRSPALCLGPFPSWMDCVRSCAGSSASPRLSACEHACALCNGLQPGSDHTHTDTHTPSKQKGMKLGRLYYFHVFHLFGFSEAGKKAFASEKESHHKSPL